MSEPGIYNADDIVKHGQIAQCGLPDGRYVAARWLPCFAPNRFKLVWGDNKPNT